MYSAQHHVESAAMCDALSVETEPATEISYFYMTLCSEVSVVIFNSQKNFSSYENVTLTGFLSLPSLVNVSAEAGKVFKWRHQEKTKLHVETNTFMFHDMQQEEKKTQYTMAILVKIPVCLLGAELSS